MARSELPMVSCILLSLWSDGACGQVQLPPFAPAQRSYCAAAEDTPTWKNCWECYKELVADCTKTFNTQAEQDACYQTARDFYAVCMASTASLAKPAGLEMEVDQATILDVRTIFVLEATTLRMTDPALLSVYLVPDSVSGTPISSIGHAAQVSSSDWVTFEITVDPTLLELRAGELIGLIVVVTDPTTLLPVDVGAISLAVTDSLDLNQDGRFDSYDYVAALVRYANGELDAETFYEFADAYRRR